ncbi:hypothetical protein N8I74_17955 [Chitiniphilus purpureus]|uniref:RNA-binding protein n=1 Tax=Chitiniphilus purpureus TaxID=2981137 RepID=A0ABY6DNC5_9NEIS|nr:hypothetical protein [Chitiniphilus sp. CD1]UXY15173.1 hypothetical protein N8I74_17955 [Chitiniphilus sp. CD1]
MQLLLGNLPPTTEADDVRSLLEGLGVPGVGDIVVSTGEERSDALIRLEEVSAIAISACAQQLDGYHWRGHDLTATHTHLSWD